MPALAKVYAEYAPKGVVFLGLTSESEGDVGTIRNYIKTVPGFDWPVGYGEVISSDALGITGIPTMIVFGPDGNATWSGHNTHGLAEALDEALAAGR